VNIDPTLLSFLTVAGLSGVVVEVARSFLQRKKLGSDFAANMATAASELVGPLRVELAEARKEVGLARREAQVAVTESRLRERRLAEQFDARARDYDERESRVRDQLRIAEREASMLREQLGAALEDLALLRAAIAEMGIQLPRREEGKP
jgi:hypothetical protein